MPIPKHLQAIIGRGQRLTRALHTPNREDRIEPLKPIGHIIGS
jgi:hypothetical protein